MPCNHCQSTAFTPIFMLKGYELVRCGDCALAYVINPPSAEELKRIYSATSNYHVQLHDPASDTWRSFEALAQTHMAFVRQQIGGGRVLDVGCSTGHFLAAARTHGFEVEGAEFSADSARVAREHFGLTITDGSVHQVGAAPGSFDLVTMFDVIEHVPDPTADIAAVWRLLKPGGWFVLSTPNIDGLFPRLSLPLARALNHWPHPEPPHHLYQFSVRTLAAMLEKAGFLPGAVSHTHIPLSYTFGSPAVLARSPKRAAYAALFAPLALAGPWIGQGDWFYIAARKPT